MLLSIMLLIVNSRDAQTSTPAALKTAISTHYTEDVTLFFYEQSLSLHFGNANEKNPWKSIIKSLQEILKLSVKIENLRILSIMML